MSVAAQHGGPRTSATRSGREQHHLVTLSVLAVACTAYGLLQSLILPALPTLTRSVHASVLGGGWILTAYLISATVATPVIGRLGDLYGKRRSLIVVLVVTAVGCLLSATAHSLLPMLFGRVLQGSVGGLFPLGFAIIRDEFPVEKVAGGIGLVAAIIGVGGGVGLVVAGPIIDHLSTHWLFWVPLIMALASALATFLWIPESPYRSNAPVNWLAMTLLSVWLVALLLGITEGPTWGWGDRRILGLFALAALATFAWVRVELRSQTPLIDVRTMALRPVWLTNTASLLLGFGMLAAYVLIPQFVETPRSAGYGFGASVTGAGLFLIPANALMLLVGVYTGRIARLIGSKRMLAIGAILAAAAFVILTVAHGRPLDIYLDTLLLGAGIGCASAATPNVIVQSVPHDQTGAATGVNVNARSLGSALGSSVVITVLSSHVRAGAAPPEGRYVAAFLVCVGVLLVGFLVVLAVPVRRHVIDALAEQPPMPTPVPEDTLVTPADGPTRDEVPDHVSRHE